MMPNSLSTDLLNTFQTNVYSWLVTGAAGFIGSNLVENLLLQKQKVIALDNFATGKKETIEELKSTAEKYGSSFKFFEGDIRDSSLCVKVTTNVDFILHQAALGSVPMSVKIPQIFHDVNVTGFLNLLEAARINSVKKIVYASSCAVYGDDQNEIKVEQDIGEQLSPYGANKLCNEIYARTYKRTFGLNTVGLRYFNIFGKRQDPNGAYAAVIPIWITNLLANKPIYINGDGFTTRDFCHVDNVAFANIKAALSKEELPDVFNVGTGKRTSLNDLYRTIKSCVEEQKNANISVEPEYREFRKNDIRDSLANISQAKSLLNYKVFTDLKDGIDRTIRTYC